MNWKTVLVKIDQRIAWYMEQAKTFKAGGNYEAACRSYESALELAPEAVMDLRAKILTLLSLACFDAAQAKKATQWAEQAVRLQPSPFFLIHAHSAAGIGYAARGMYAESERHRSLEYKIALEFGSREQIAASLNHLMLVKKSLGKLDEVLRYCEETTDARSPRARTVRHLHSDCLLAQGRFQEAWDQLTLAATGTPFADPFAEARIQAVLELATGQVEGAWALCGGEGSDGRAQDAERHIQEALSHLGSDPKMRLWGEAALTWVLALNGNEQQSRNLLGRIDWQLKTTATIETFDRDTRLQCFGALGRASYILGNFAPAAAYWRSYLDHVPALLGQTTAWYFLGECHLSLGDMGPARDAFAHALAPGIDTYHARLAVQRLSELDAPVPNT